MRHFYRGIISTIIVFLFVSCNNTSREKFSPPTFEKHVKLEYTVVQDTLLLKYPRGIISFDKYIVINALIDGKYIHIYDKQTGEYLGGYVRKGQGPGEIASAVGCERIDYYKKERIITMLERNTNQYFIFAINDDSENLLTFEAKKSFSDINSVGSGKFNRLLGIYRIDENIYLSDSRIYPLPNNNKRFSLITETGEKTAEYNNFATDNFWAYVSQSPRISLSPNRKKIACSTFYGAVLETFEINNSINLIREKLFYPIILDIRNDVAYPTDETVMGFFDICTSNEYIFTIFCGSKESPCRNNISVFNWNGDPVIRFETDIDLYYICYNENDNFIYAFARIEDGEFILVKFDVSEYL